MWKVLAWTLCLCAAAAAAAGQQVKKVSCSGKVTDAKGRPLAGATVEAYLRDDDYETGKSRLRRVAKIETDSQGAFSLSFDVEKEYAHGLVVAFRKGLALGWGRWHSGKDKHEFAIELGKPERMAGRVVDEAGAPIAGASVRAFLRAPTLRGASWIVGLEGFERLAATTAADGSFSITDIPAEASGDFLVSAPGRATISTLKKTPDRRRLQFAAGRTDIRLVLPPEARIHGRAVEKGTGKPVNGVRLMARLEKGVSGYEVASCVSDPDGRFSLSGLQAGRYRLRLITPREGMADWVGKDVVVSTQAGRTTENVTVQLSKGGIVEVTVADQADDKPIPGARVSLYQETTRRWHSGRTDEKGAAWIRLPPGSYRLHNAYMRGYASRQLDQPLEVAEGKTRKLTVGLKVEPKVRGVVLDPAGEPLAGAAVRVLPGGGDPTRTGKDGQFEVGAWASGWPEERQPQFILVARHVQRNLAAALELEEDLKAVRLKLQPAVTLTGRVTEEGGKPIPDARVTVMLRGHMWGSSIQPSGLRTDAHGYYEVEALPAGREYDVSTEAEGFGGAEVHKELAEDQAGPVELATLVLPPANLSISGMVLDQDGKAVANARVVVADRRQPYRRTDTDEGGKFTIERVVGEQFRVQASATVAGERQSGAAEAKGGDKDVKIVLGQYPGSRPKRPQPQPLLGKPLPDLAAVGLKPAAGKRILVCFWDMEQRPSRRSIRMLAARAAELAGKDVLVISVHASAASAETLNQWVEKFKISIPVGRAPSERSEREKLLRAWGVRGLPWFILTDRKHVIRAEGFSLTELDKQL